jgi:hypothetical protein
VNSATSVPVSLHGSHHLLTVSVRYGNAKCHGPDGQQHVLRCERWAKPIAHLWHLILVSCCAVLARHCLRHQTLGMIAKHNLHQNNTQCTGSASNESISITIALELKTAYLLSAEAPHTCAPWAHRCQPNISSPAVFDLHVP